MGLIIDITDDSGGLKLATPLKVSLSAKLANSDACRLCTWPGLACPANTPGQQGKL